jgi:hypothetical protein
MGLVGDMRMQQLAHAREEAAIGLWPDLWRNTWRTAPQTSSCLPVRGMKMKPAELHFVRTRHGW